MLVVLDADFLSSFLKIERLALVRELYRVDHLRVPEAAYREIAVTQLLPRLAADPHLELRSPDPARLASLRGDPAFSALGTGEQEAIALAMSETSSVLLINDKKAAHWAANHGVLVTSTPAFLLACRHAELLDLQQLQKIVELLEQRDHFGFSKRTLELLFG